MLLSIARYDMLDRYETFVFMKRKWHVCIYIYIYIYIYWRTNPPGLSRLAGKSVTSHFTMYMYISVCSMDLGARTFEIGPLAMVLVCM